MDSRGPKSMVRAFGAVVLALNVAVAAFSLAGTAGLRGGVVPPWDYDSLSRTLAQANLLSGFLAALLLMWHDQGGRRTLLLLAACGVIAGGLELVGTLTGVPFGAYRYTDRLGPRLAGHLPYLIPAAWFMMLYPALHLSAALLRSRWAIGTMAAGLMVLWDVVLDPAMSGPWPMWIWQQPGWYYGIPWTNFTGWYATAWLTAMAYLGLAPRWRRRSDRLALILYLNQSLFAAGLAALVGRAGAVVPWAAGLAAFLIYRQVKGPCARDRT